MQTIPENKALLKEFIKLLQAHRHCFKQQRVFEMACQLALAELAVFARHTVTQLLMVLGLNGEDWSRWYRLFSQQRFDYGQARKQLFRECLQHVKADELLVVAGDGTQTRRSSRKMEGAHWLHNPQSPVFKRGIHIAQRWFNGSWLLPAEQGYSRAVPIDWIPAFTAKSKPEADEPRKEWEAAVLFLKRLRANLKEVGRETQPLLMVADGSYDTINLWRHLPDKVVLCVRSAKNRVLHHLPDAGSRPNRKYGERAPQPSAYWQLAKEGRAGGKWKRLTLTVRGRQRRLQYKVAGPFLRKLAPDRPLFLIVVRGKGKKPRRRGRVPLPFLVNAVQNDSGQWELPLSVDTLLFWAWQRWEVEVAHRELKSNFGLGDKQCWSPHAAILSVQWSSWVYALALLAGYRTWGLTASPPVPTKWWRGSQRWSLNTLFRGFRAAMWGGHTFTPVVSPSWTTASVFAADAAHLRHAAFAAARS